MAEVKAEETPAVIEAPMVESAPPLSKAGTEAPAASSTEGPAPAEITEASSEVKEEKDEAKAAEPVEIKTISEGWLEFKPHGILHFISTKKFFYLQDEPIATDNLTSYLKKEKPEATHSTAAHASQTGKGLLFYAKTESQKAHPIGIIKLADVVEVISTGTTRFSLKLTSESWNFESSAADRDSWVQTLKTKVSEAKEGAEGVTSSEGYQQALRKFGKKTSAKAPETSKEKEEDKEEKKEEKKDEEDGKSEEKEEKKEEKKKEKEKKEGAKSDESSDSSSSDDEVDVKGKKPKRSNSKKSKRASFFGIIGHKDKKEDKKEKREDKVEEKKDEEAKAEEPKPEVTQAEASTDVTAPAVEEEKPAEDPKPTEEPVKVESPPTEGITTPKGSKRHSFFGFFDKKKEVEKKDAETVKDREAVSDTPPVIAPIGEEPKEATAEETKPVEASTSAAPVDSSAKTPSSPPKESFLDKLFKPKEKAASPAAVAPAVVSEEKKDEPAAAETKPEETEAVKETEEKVADASSPKDGKRRASFFSLGKKKAADVKSDTEDEPSSSRSQPTSPLPKKLNLFRKNSKSAKDAPKPETTEDVPPVPEITATATETPAPTTTETPAPATTETAAPATTKAAPPVEGTSGDSETAPATDTTDTTDAPDASH